MEEGIATAVPSTFPGLTQKNFGDKRDRKMTDDAHCENEIDSEVTEKLEDSPMEKQNLPFS
jgi:hypothetical protein